MLFRILRESFFRGKRRKLIAVTAIALGTGIATGLFSVALNSGDKINRELKRYGANLIVLPQEDSLPLEVAGFDYSALLANGYLQEADLPRLKATFWRHNIVGFVPELPARVELRTATAQQPVTLIGTWFDRALPVQDQPDFRTGVRHVVSYWQVEGAWISDAAEREVMIGNALARRLNLSAGDSLTLAVAQRLEKFFIRGLISTGGPEEQQLFAPLAVVQRLVNQPGKIKKILVSALTNPEDDFARQPIAQMTREEYDRWYCTPYVSSIALQLREAIPGAETRIVRQVAEGEGALLRKTSLLMFLIALAIFCTSILGVTSTMTTTVLERRKEVGLFRALGAEARQISSVFIGEALIMGLIGGLAGCGLGHLLARKISLQIFGDPLQYNLLSLPIAVVIAVFIALLGSFFPLRKALTIDPIVTLHSA